MGAGSSQPKAPTIVHRDPPPNAQALRGLSVNGSQGCKPGRCVLIVPQGVSSSSVKLSREQGSVSLKECQQLAQDTAAVQAQRMALDEFKGNLVAGKYFRQQTNGYCSQLMLTDDEVQGATTIDQIPWSKARIPSIRKLSATGGYSSSTKVFLRPEIPFQISFGGQSSEVNIMTLFHPSPIRIENVQHDAILTLGDPGAGSKLVVMIPLVGSLVSGQSGEFVARVASYLPGILRPGSSGQYDPIDAPTGNDWSLSKVFPGTPENGRTVVDVGYFSWNATPPLEEYQRNYVSSPNPQSDHQYIGWRPTGPLGATYVMLKDAVPINPFDLQTIKMLPVTPSEEAIPPPLMMTLVYQPPSSCSAGKESFTTSKINKCDPLAAFPPPTTITSDFLIKLFASVLGTIALFIGIYFALKFGTDPKYADRIKQWGESFGRQLATVRGSVKKAAQSTSTATGQVARSIANSTQRTKQAIANSIDERRRSWRRKSAPSAIQAEIKRREADERVRAKRRATAQNAIADEIKKRDQEKARIEAAKKKLEEEKKRREAIRAFKEAEANEAKKKAEEEEAAKKKAAEEEAARDKARRKSLMTYRAPNVTRRQPKPKPKPKPQDDSAAGTGPLSKKQLEENNKRVADEDLPIRINRKPGDGTRRRPPPVAPPTIPKKSDDRIESAKQKVKDIQAKVEERKKAEEKEEQETKERITKAKKRIAEITDATRKRKEQEELAEFEEKRKKIEEETRIAKEQAARDLEEARLKLRLANEQVRRAWKKGGRKHRSKHIH